MLSVTITKGIIRQKVLLEDSAKKDSSKLDKSAYKLVTPGDIAYNKMRAWQGAIGVSEFRGIVSPAYVVQRPRVGINPRFFHHLFRIPSFAREAERWSYGITSDMWSLRPEHFKLIYSCIPSIEEQDAIVHFLDHADRRIRRAIRAKRKLIALLNEQKQVITHQVVTRGLNPDVQLKPSGVEWLGDVPEHWKILPIKRAFVSMDYGISSSATDSGTIRLLTMGNIREGKVSIPESGGVVSVESQLLLKSNDLLFNRTNSAELVGKVGIFFTEAEVSVTFASYLVRLRPTSANDAGFLNLLLNDPSVLSMARREAIPSLHQPNLNPTRYGRLLIALPPLEEQQVIVSYVQESTVALDKGIAGPEREISLLLELRTRLISDVVTGKLDVREAAAQLPSEEDTAEAIDDAEALTEDEEAPEDDEPEEVEA